MGDMRKWKAQLHPGEREPVNAEFVLVSSRFASIVCSRLRTDTDVVVGRDRSALSPDAASTPSFSWPYQVVNNETIATELA